MKKDFLYPLRCLHGQIHEKIQRIKIKKHYLDRIKALKRNNTQFVFLVLTPEHSNLGDHAIAYAESQLLTQAGISYIEISGKQLWEMRTYNLLGLMNHYPILIQGGGYLGTLWYNAESLLRSIIVSNPDSKLILLPNTIYYEESDWGKSELQNSIQIYNKHNNLTIYAREKTSYNTMKSLYRDVQLVPDIVLSLSLQMSNQRRQGCLICLRKDHEKTITETQEQIIRNQARLLYGENVSDTDMMAESPVSISQRESALFAKFEQFAKAELVITDRLHGMIFCAITGTPCILVNSISPKIRGCYDWICHLKYIRFVENVEDIVNECRTIPNTEHEYDNSQLTHFYRELVQDIRHIL